MTERRTRVDVAGVTALTLPGHVDPARAIDSTRRYYEHQRDQAEAVLAAMVHTKVAVYWQRGVYKATGVAQVWPRQIATPTRRPGDTSTNPHSDGAS